MKILIVQDSDKWAIGKLSRVIQDFNKHLDIEILSIPPKELRAYPEQNMQKFEDKVKSFNPDVIHFQYWDIANTLSKSEVCFNRKLILTHHNQKNLLSHDWHNFDLIVVHTQKAKEILETAGYWNVRVIQHGIDVEKFQFKEKLDMNNKLLGYVGRVVPWKGLYDILKVAKEIDTEVLMMGYIDRAEYWQKCQEFNEQMDIRFKTEEQVKCFHEMACYVGNSDDGIEEGTLGFLEAMACGIPVITTPSGEAKDIIQDGVNGILVNFNDYEDLKYKISVFYGMPEKDRDKMRENAWNTVRNMSQEVMARKYEKVYYETLYRNDLVSIIIPTCKRADTIKNVLDGYAKQTYHPIELIIVVDDEWNEEYEGVLFKWKMENNIPIKWLYTYNKGYGLAQARNMGIFEATGHYLIFNDDRYIPNNKAVEIFIERLKGSKERSAVWGDKGAGKRDFMENFFAIRKKDISDAGMFNERGNQYGFQSQEIRERFRNLGYKLFFEPMAQADTQFGTHNKTNKRYEIFKSKLMLWKLKN